MVSKRLKPYLLLSLFSWLYNSLLPSFYSMKTLKTYDQYLMASSMDGTVRRAIILHFIIAFSCYLKTKLSLFF